MSERASRGEGFRKMEGIPDHLSGRSFTRAVLKTVLAALVNHIMRERGAFLREATGVSEVDMHAS